MQRQASTHTVPGFRPTPRSGRNARFDNFKIAQATEVAGDVHELEAITGYSLEDGGAFRRRLANMVRNGQIDPRFAPSRRGRQHNADEREASGSNSRMGANGAGRSLGLASGSRLQEGIAEALGGRWIGDINVPMSGGVSVARRSLTFDPGDIADMPISVPPAFRRKGLVTVAGSSLFAELAVARLFKLAGWTAYWRDGYGRGWVADGDLARNHLQELPESLGRAVVAAVARVRGSLSGCWDVVAWTDDRVAFAECKRRAGDRLTDTQGLWLRAGLAVGVPRAAFVVVEWDLTAPSQ